MLLQSSKCEKKSLFKSSKCPVKSLLKSSKSLKSVLKSILKKENVPKFSKIKVRKLRRKFVYILSFGQNVVIKCLGFKASTKQITERGTEKAREGKHSSFGVCETAPVSARDKQKQKPMERDRIQQLGVHSLRRALFALRPSANQNPDLRIVTAILAGVLELYDAYTLYRRGEPVGGAVQGVDARDLQDVGRDLDHGGVEGTGGARAGHPGALQTVPYEIRRGEDNQLVMMIKVDDLLAQMINNTNNT